MFFASTRLLTVVSLLLAACKKDTTTTPAYTVQIQLQGTDTAGLLAQANFYQGSNGAIPQTIAEFSVYDGKLDTEGLGAATFAAKDEVVLEVGLRAVTATSSTKAKPTSKIVGSILVNGVVKGTVTLDSSVKYWSNTYASTDVHVIIGQ